MLHKLITMLPGTVGKSEQQFANEYMKENYVYKIKI